RAYCGTEERHERAPPEPLRHRATTGFVDALAGAAILAWAALCPILLPANSSSATREDDRFVSSGRSLQSPLSRACASITAAASTWYRACTPPRRIALQRSRKEQKTPANHDD